MKKLFLTLCLISAAALAGCAGGSGDNQAAGAEVNAERLTITGEITESVGNMLTLSLVERAEPIQLTEEQIAEMRERARQNLESAFEGLTEEELQEMREQFASGDGESFRIPEGGDGPVTRRNFQDGEGEITEGFFIGGPPEGFDPENMPEGFTRLGRGIDYTGESREIIIPAGAPIYEQNFVDGEMIDTEISLDKLKTGDLIEVTYASDNETVSKVVKQQALGMGSTRMGVPGGAFPGGGGAIIPEDGVFFMMPDGGQIVGGGRVPTPGR